MIETPSNHDPLVGLRAVPSTSVALVILLAQRFVKEHSGVHGTYAIAFVNDHISSRLIACQTSVPVKGMREKFNLYG